MKSLMTTLPKLLVLALFLALAPAALASNTWYVDGVNGNDGNICKSLKYACKTIGHAISLAASGDSVRVAPATYTENLTISISLTVLGAYASTTIIDGGAVNTVVTISGTSAQQVILSGLTIRNGYNQNYGGGIVNFGTLTVNNSIITANSANYGGGGIENFTTLTINHSTITGSNLSDQDGSGGAILNWAVLTINQSAISGNSAGEGPGIYSGCCGLTSTVTTINDSTISGNSGTWGGGIYITSGTGAINNSTITGNSATDGGGGIISYGTLTINNATISGNSSAAGAGFFQVTNYGGSATFQNSIVAENSGGNCLTNPNGIYSNGYNLSSDDTCNFSNTGDMNNKNPQLGTLQNNGGPTQTISELPGSVTIDAGNPSGCTDGNGNLLTTDQRGAPRPGKYKHDKRCDMGAFERQTD
ncbi:MAG: choice-of-anchor Q domain-containing protein [Candidatus Sulfotelmatobacter sp.]